MKGNGMKLDMRHAAFGALLAACLLASGCKKAPEEPPEANIQEPVEAPAAPVNEVTPPPAPAPKPEQNAAAPIPDDDDKPTVSDQTREDAEATGMTSRMQPAEAQNEEAPAATNAVK
jgi:hypothetical protein